MQHGQLKLQAFSFNDDLITEKLAMAAILFILAGPEMITMKEPLNNDHFALQIVGLSSMKASGHNLDVEEHYSEDEQTFQVRSKMMERIVDSIIVSDSYESNADLVLLPNNKCFMYFITQLISGMSSHFSSGFRLTKEISRTLIRKLAYFLDYTNVEDVSQIEAEFKITFK